MLQMILEDSSRKTFSKYEELAYIYCHYVENTLGNWINEHHKKIEALNKNRFWSKFQIILGLIALIPIAVAYTINYSYQNPVILGGLISIIVAGIGFFRFQSASAQLEEELSQKPSIVIDKIESCSWQGEAIPIGDQIILTDNTGVFPSNTFEYNSFNEGWEKPQDELRELHHLMSNPPIISKFSNSPDYNSFILGNYETDIVHKIEMLDQTVSDLKRTILKTRIIPSEDSFSNLYKEGQVPEEWKNKIDTAQLTDTAKNLHSLYKQSSSSSQEDDIEEKKILQFSEDCKIAVKSLNKKRDESIVDWMETTLTEIKKSFRFPISRFICPKCSDKASEGLSFKNMEIYDPIMLVDESYEIDNDDEKRNLREKLKNRDAIYKAATLKLDLETGKFYCVQCGTSHSFESAEAHTILNMKEDIVYPLWDLLWEEVSIERQRIIREREDQLLKSRTKEHEELNNVMAEFSSERRRIVTKLSDVIETCEKISESSHGLLNSLLLMKLLDDETADHYKKLVLDDYNKIRNQLDNLEKKINQEEAMLQQSVENLLETKTILLDLPDEEKKKKRFLNTVDENILELV